MSGRIGKSLALICAMASFIAAMGSSSVISRAEEYAGDNMLVAEPEQPVYEESEGDSEDEIIGDFIEASLGYDVCFFIKNKVDADIPNEPDGHPSSDYLAAIRIDDDAASDSFIYDQDFEESTDGFESDGFTARSEVLSRVKRFPTEDEIKTVYPEFDPESQYVFWYVFKKASTAEPNTDVFLHVDGVVRTRQCHSSGEEEDEPDPAPGGNTDPGEDIPGGDKPVEEPAFDPEDISFNVYSKNVESIVRNGEEYVGGFVVEILDKNSNLLTQYVFGINGQLISEDSPLGACQTGSGNIDTSLGNDIGINWGAGKSLSYNGLAFHVNVDAAYIKKVNDEFQVIPLLFAGSEVKPGEIMVSDAAGNALASATSVPRVTEKHKVTVTAGTSVQNDNGQTLTNTEAIVSGGSLMKGHRIEATFNGSQTGPGESVNEITDIHIYDSNGREATAYYDVTLKKGKLILVDSKGSAADDNSTGSAVTRILVRDENETTISNSQHALGSGREDADSIQTGTATASFKKMSYSDKTVKDGQLDSDKKAFADGQVLGARRADTGDYTVNAGARLALIVLCLMLISIIEIKRNKTK
ncbi:hypothetical protein [Butyrivibrio proteoclasticus]|uniref:hypothetical protein n=1 Tax=Butyrivibrio proteoclasticus TaxID=43305 RepID=UPI00047E704D|nr:hypothetical protein [Butyrivibrio proteoclasticus]